MAFRESYNQLKKLLQYGIGHAFSILVPLLVAKTIIDICGEEFLGKQSVALSICFILSIVIDYGSFVNPLKKVSINRNDSLELSEIFSQVLFARIPLLLVTFIVFVLLVFLVPFLCENKVLYFLSFFIVISQFFNPFYFLQGLENFKAVAFFTGMSKLVYALSIFLFLSDPNDYLYVNFIFGITHSLVYIIAILFIIKTYNLKIIFPGFESVKSYLKEDFHLLGNNFSLVSVAHSPIILVGFLLGDFYAGLYKVLDIFLSLFRNYNHLFFHSIFPRTCFLLKESHRKGTRFILKYSLISSIVLLSIFLVFYLNREFFLSYFVEDNYEIISSLLKFIAIIVFLGSLNIPFQQVLFYYDLKKYYVSIYLLASIITIVFNYIFITFFNFDGVFFGGILTELFILFGFVYSTEFMNKNISLLKNEN
ncbi:MAG: oligosaccharide flippase family protein [Flavobacteriales bacterium]|nr:oligosaccharide flippase family protein [Flavobacteriales bacterium]